MSRNNFPAHCICKTYTTDHPSYLTHTCLDISEGLVPEAPCIPKPTHQFHVLIVYWHKGVCVEPAHILLYPAHHL